MVKIQSIQKRNFAKASKHENPLNTPFKNITKIIINVNALCEKRLNFLFKYKDNEI